MRAAEEIGDLLFTIVNLARHLNVDAEEALRQTIARFGERFREIERRAKNTGRKLEDMTLEEMDSVWESAKREEPT
jgi:ATP diphosphatase